jgi:enoyl-CoA hydratase/carnithine racemase
VEQVRYEVDGAVARVTIDRPERHNAMSFQVMSELGEAFAAAKADDGVRVVVLTGAGERAFCTGVDRASVDPRAVSDEEDLPGWTTPWTYVDPGQSLGPKANDCWKPVIAAVNGMACGGAFYILGEVEFIIAADHATFFEPHLQAGLPAVYEPIHLAQKIPFQEVMRMALLGSYERMSAQRAYEIGLVSQVVPKEELHDVAEWAARAIASADPLPVMGTVRAVWNAREVPRRQAIDLAYLYIRIGQDKKVMQESMERFASGGRVEWRLR